MTGRQVDRIREIARPVVEQHGAFLVDLMIRRDHGLTSLEVFVDTDSGVTTDLCAEISRSLSRELDIAGVMKQRYHFVVSSPGADRPLKFSRQYRHNIGRELQVKVRGEHSAEVVSGILVSADDDAIVLRIGETETKNVPFDSIVEARVKMPW